MSKLATSSRSPTPRSCAFRWTSCSTTADLPAPAVTPVSAVTASPLAAAAATASPSPALLERLTPEQRSSFLRVWERLPSHLHAFEFDLHGPDWTPWAIEQLGDVLRDFAHVVSKSKTDLGCRSLIPFEILVPKNSAAVSFRPHQINPTLAKSKLL